MSQILSPQTKNFNEQDNISLRIVDGDSHIAKSERDLDDYYFRNTEKQVRESMQLKRSMTIAEKIRAQSPCPIPELEISCQPSQNTPKEETPFMLDRTSSVRPVPVAELYPQQSFEALTRQFEQAHIKKKPQIAQLKLDSIIKPYNSRKGTELTFKPPNVPELENSLDAG